MLNKKCLEVPLGDWIWLILLSLWRLFIATRHGLGVDEAHYVLYGLHLDWSYFDHPPLIGWVQGVFAFLLGKHEWAARLPAVLCGLASSLMIYRLCLKINNHSTVSRWVTVAINSAFLPAALWIMFLPDTLLLVLALWLVFVVDRILERGHFFDWVSLGLCLGLCGLTKYTAVFFVPSLLGILYSERALAILFNPMIFVSVVVGAVTISPVLYWNYKHQWISFSYQLGHVAGGQKLNFSHLGIFVASQLGAYSPFLIFPSLFGIWAKRTNISRIARICLWLGVPTLLFFCYTSLRDEVLPHWTLIGWIFIITVGTYLSFSQKTKVAIVISALITAVVMAELSISFIKFPPFQSPYADLLGWNELHDEVKEILSRESDKGFAIGVTNWTLGSRANYYLGDLADVFVLDDRFDQFDLWEKNQDKKPNLLILQWRGFQLDAKEQQKCPTLIPLKEKTFEKHGNPVNQVTLLWCRGHRW